MLSANSYISTVKLLPFQSGCSYFFSLLISVAKTLNIDLPASVRSYSHPIPDLRGKAFSFSSLSIMLAVRLLYITVAMLRCFLYTHFVKSFCCKWMLDFVKCFLSIYGSYHVSSILHFVNVVHQVD